MINPRLPAFFILFFLFAGCNQKDSGKKVVTDTTQIKADSISKTINNDSLSKITRDSIISDSNLLKISSRILQAIKAKNFKQLGAFIHPAFGLRLSPYGYIDTTNSRVLFKKDLVSLANNQHYIVWGTFDGTGEPITLGIHRYFDRFVYDRDFLKAPKQSINKILGGGNSLNNMKDIYPDLDFTEFYFPGSDPDYGGMDWRALRLVFKKIKNKPYLVAIIHDEWTI